MEPIEQIRKMLFEEIDKFRKDDSNVERARTIAKLSSQAIYSIRAELENKRLELELGRLDEVVKQWMDKDFSKISNKKGA
jgi:hypothetical protein